MSNHEHSRRHEDENRNQDSDGEFASPDDFQISRDDSGQILPEVRNTQLGKVKVVPMSYGDVEKHFGSSTVADIGPGELAKLLDKHVIRPNLSEDAGPGGVDAKYVEDLKPLAPRELIFAILDASGIDADVEMQDDGGAEVSVGN